MKSEEFFFIYHNLFLLHIKNSKKRKKENKSERKKERKQEMNLDKFNSGKIFFIFCFVFRDLFFFVPKDPRTQDPRTQDPRTPDSRTQELKEENEEDEEETEEEEENEFIHL